MTEPVEELYQVVQRQEKIYAKLLELAKAKQPVLIEGKIKELEQITKQEEALIFEVGRLEEKRISLQQVLADQFALSPEALSAGELENRLDKEMAEKFGTVFKSMVKSIEELEKINKSNTDLIQNSLEYINFSLNLLTTDDTPSYDSKDEKKKNDRSRIFDQKI